MKVTYMFDTCAFNALLDGGVELALIDKIKDSVVATHVQKDEINNTKDTERRDKLLEVFHSVVESSEPTTSFVLDVSRLDQAQLGGSQAVPTETMIWGVSRWGQAKWSAEDNLYNAIKTMLDGLNHSKASNTQDALIAETSIKNHYVLITQDRDLFKVATFFEGAVANVQSLFMNN